MHNKILHIFDVSPFVHAGNVNKHARVEKLINDGATWRTQVTPMGGVSLIFNTLYSTLGDGDFVFCTDRNPTVKKELLPIYKESREHKRDISVNKAATEYVLDKCNCTVIARAGYEADDIIYTLVKKFYDAYDKIYIYTGDSDLYFLVDDKVSIKPSSSKAKEVTLESYKALAVYNTITLNKIIKGDPNDDIPGLPTNRRHEVKEFFDKEQFYLHLGNKEFVKSWFDFMFPDLSYQVDLVFPLEVDDLPESFKKPDVRAIRNWGDVIGNKLFRNRGDLDFTAEEDIVEMQSRGYYIEESEV